MRTSHRLFRVLLSVIIFGASSLLVARSFADTVAGGDETRSELMLASVGKGAADPAPVERVGAYGMARDNRPPDELRLNLDGRDVVIIFATGDVQIGDGLTVDEASRAFWKKVGALAPTFCRARAAEQSASPRR